MQLPTKHRLLCLSLPTWCGILLCLIIGNTYATEQISIGSYWDKAMGRWSYRQRMQRPFVFNSTRKAQRFLEINYLKTMRSFWHQHAHFNLGASLSHAEKHDAVVLDFNADNAKFNMGIVSIVPELKITLWRPPAAINPYLVWSIGGISYLFGQRDHGDYRTYQWQFKDYLGAGVDYGSWTINARLVHYSGARLLTTTKGFNVPWVLSVGHRFGP